MEKSQVPFSEHKIAFAFPEYKKVEFAPDFNAYIIESDKIKAASCSIVFHSGAYDDNIEGLTALSSRGITRGTLKRSPEDLAQEIDQLGAYLNSHGNWDSTTIGAEFLADKAEQAIDIMLDSTLNAEYRESEIENFKRIHLTELDIDSFEPNYLAFEKIQKSLFAGSQYAMTRSGSHESVGTIDRNAMLAWRDNLLSAPKKSIFISIDKGAEKIAENIMSAFANIKSKPQSDAAKLVFANKAIKPELALKDEAPQASIRLGKIWKTYRDAGFVESQIANTVFGGYFLSRLNETIRVKRGFSYGAFSDLIARKNAGALVVSANLGYENLCVAFDDIYGEIKNLYENKIDAGELNQAKQYFLGSFARALETPNQTLRLLQAIELYGLQKNHYENLFESVLNSTPDSIFEIQRELFKPSDWHIAISGDSSELEKSIGSYDFTKYF